MLCCTTLGVRRYLRSTEQDFLLVVFCSHNK